MLTEQVSIWNFRIKQFQFLSMKLLIILLFTFNISFGQIRTKYVIKSITELSEEMYRHAKQFSTNTSRKNITGTEVILKFEGNVPIVFKNDSIYDHSGIRKELAKEEWRGYSGGLKIVGEYIITDSPYKDQISIGINDWMFIKPIPLKDGMWAVPYDLYLKYQTIIDSKIDLLKFIIKDLRKKEFINQL